MARREYQGGAVASTITGGITNVSGTATLSTVTGWPTSSFSAVLNKGLSGEEKVLATRSGTTITFTTRGYDGTTATSHSAGSTISPCSTAIDFDEANTLVSGITAGTGIAMPGSTSGSTLLKSTAVAGSTTLTLPAVTDTLVGKTTTDTLTNKTLTAPIISTISNTGTLTLPTSTDTLVGKATTDTLTNKTLTNPVIDLPQLGFATQATANSTLTLTVASKMKQEFTGSTAGQIVVMPVTSTLGVGMKWVISNKSTQTIAVQSSGANAIVTVAAATDVEVTCNAITGTTASSWSYSIIGFTSAPGGGMTLLSTTSLSGASTTISSISGSYKSLIILWNGTADSNAIVTIKPNSSASICSYAGVKTTSTAFTATGTNFNPAGDSTNCGLTQYLSSLTIFDYASSTDRKPFSFVGGQNSASNVSSSGGIFDTTTAISSLLFGISSGTFTGGTVRIYGVA